MSVGLEIYTHVSDDILRLRAEQERRDEAPETDRNPMVRITLKRVLPLEGLLSYGQTWFAPDSEVDVNTSLILKNHFLQEQEGYKELVSRAYLLRDYAVNERRNQMNPFRANLLFGIVDTSITVLLDHENYLTRRLSADSKPGDKLKLTTKKQGHAMEKWLGTDAFELLAEKALELKEIVKQKKLAGKEVQVVKEKFETTLKLSIKEVKRRVEIAKVDPFFKPEFNIDEAKKELDRAENGEKNAPFTQEEASSIYALGKLIMRYLGTSDKGDEVGIPLTLEEKIELLSAILEPKPVILR